MENTNHKKSREFLYAIYGDIAEAERLFRAEPQFLHYRSSVGETAFHYLIVESDIDRATLLLDWGADINSQDNFGATPLIHAVIIGNLDVVSGWYSTAQVWN